MPCDAEKVDPNGFLASRSYKSGSPVPTPAVPKRKAHPAATELTAKCQAASTPVAELNRAVTKSTGRFVIFIDPLVKITEQRWLDYLLLYGELEDVAFVAPNLYRPDGRVAAAGLLITKEGLIPAMRRFKLGDDGYAGSLACNREVSALPAGMIMMKRSIFDVLGGLDTDFSTLHYTFADATVRAAELGYRNIAIATPLLRVDDAYDIVEVTRSSDAILFQELHADIIKTGDPFHNVNFASEQVDYTA